MPNLGAKSCLQLGSGTEKDAQLLKPTEWTNEPAGHRMNFGGRIRESTDYGNF